ncbi:MAG: AtpZ/AtpI family protein [Bacteroidetes bacterium]|nr:AtpZ/AtpI family protein [Bacteroidota bacterium]
MNKEKPNCHNYLKYSGIAFQMLIIILIGVFGGMELDKSISWNFPVFTLIFSILSVSFSIYYVVKDIIKFK